jgi:hypothetical protein
MSFGATNGTKAAENNLSGISNTALNTQVPALDAAGTQQLAAGNQTVQQGLKTMQPGINYFQNILSGSPAETANLLAPNIQQIKQANQQNIQAASTLMPRGGGRFGTLFSAETAPNQAIQNLFSGARSAAASPLISAGGTQAGIGLGQGNLGANLFQGANSALGVGTGANTSQIQAQQQQQQLTNSLWSGLGSGLFNLATTPFGGGAAANGLLGLI